jgi:hypothetical protein
LARGPKAQLCPQPARAGRVAGQDANLSVTVATKNGTESNLRSQKYTKLARWGGIHEAKSAIAGCGGICQRDGRLVDPGQVQTEWRPVDFAD